MIFIIKYSIKVLYEKHHGKVTCKFNKMVYSDYTKKGIIHYYQLGRCAPVITSR